MLDKYMSITTFILMFVVFGLNVYLTIDLFLKIRKLMLFKKQEVRIYENKRMLKVIVLSTLIVMPVMFILNTIFFALYMATDKTTYSICLEIAALIFIGFAIYFDLYILKISKAAIVVNKNDKLAFLDDVVDVKDITNIRNDIKRKNFFINFKTEDGVIGQVKLKYHWRLKDFLDELKVEKEFI
ncbi:hypothetical protein [[Acholeplasma] multilocale]|uniref:hypothetical protein n=1 Tax=[Acholeplasma] multilocale TaxID=264638 RepID=UPI00047BC7FE|nr:hypothetical protein [[Acholeplasma] multilocale]